MKKVLLLGSGHSVSEVNNYPYKEEGWTIVAVNNAWKACPDLFDYHICPLDYEEGPAHGIGSYGPRQKYSLYTEFDLEPFGGNEQCGLSVVLNVSYWCLRWLEPDVIGYLGCDMDYTPREDGSTHFYGIGKDIVERGIPDPDHMVELSGSEDPDYLKNIYMRFFYEAEKWNGCTVVNLSSAEVTRLPYPRAEPSNFIGD